MTAPPDCPWTSCCEAFFDTDLTPGEQQRYEEHLESCPSCQDRLDRAEEDDSLLRNLGRQVGDPTVIATDPTLSHVLERTDRGAVSGPWTGRTARSVFPASKLINQVCSAPSAITRCRR